MAVVLVGPPGVAQPDAEVAKQDAGYIAGPPGAEDLPVPGVMAQEPDLGEYHRQERGDDSKVRSTNVPNSLRQRPRDHSLARARPR